MLIVVIDSCHVYGAFYVRSSMRLSLQLGENLLGTGDGDLAGVALVLGVGDLAVVEDHSPATAVLR